MLTNTQTTIGLIFVLSATLVVLVAVLIAMASRLTKRSDEDRKADNECWCKNLKELDALYKALEMLRSDIASVKQTNASEYANLRNLASRNINYLTEAMHDAEKWVVEIKDAMYKTEENIVRTTKETTQEIDKRVATTHGDIFVSLNKIKAGLDFVDVKANAHRDTSASDHADIMQAVATTAKILKEDIEVVRQRLELHNETDVAIRKELNYRNQLRSQANTRIEAKKQEAIKNQQEALAKEKEAYKEICKLKDANWTDTRISNRLALGGKAEVVRIYTKGRNLNWERDNGEEKEQY